jgi:hypothetical protein
MRVWVDAGHGGSDPGAIGPNGLQEKNITLAVARKLAIVLLDKGYEVGFIPGALKRHHPGINPFAVCLPSYS